MRRFRVFESLVLAVAGVCLGLVSLATAGAAAPPEEPVYDNPVVLNRADPWVVLHDDGYYYMTATVPEYDRLEVRRSRTIDGLGDAEPVVVWRKHAAGEMGAHIWAPELHRIDGKWYIYFAAGGAEDVWRIRMYVLECEGPDPLEDAWVERGQIETAWDSFSLDATTFEHRGVRYLVWAQTSQEPGHVSCLYIAELENPWTIRGEPVLLTRPDLGWEQRGHRVNEGAAVLHRHGRLFLTYSASATDSNYCIGLLTADEDADPLDPASWHKSPHPVFSTYEASKVFGPGHSCFTTTPDGGTDLLVYHARDYRDIDGDPLSDPNRHTRVQVLQWHDDGTPDFGYPLPNADAP